MKKQLQSIYKNNSACKYNNDIPIDQLSTSAEKNIVIQMVNQKIYISRLLFCCSTGTYSFKNLSGIRS